MPNPQTKTSSPSTLQFSLRTALLWVGYFAIVFGWFRWTWSGSPFRTYHPGWWGCFGIGILGFAFLVARSPTNRETIWGISSIGWIVCLANTVRGIVYSFGIMGGPDHQWSDIIYQQVNESMVATTTLPMAISIPLLYRLVFPRDNDPPKVPCWPRIIAAIATIDVVALWLLTLMLLQFRVL